MTTTAKPSADRSRTIRLAVALVGLSVSLGACKMFEAPIMAAELALPGTPRPISELQPTAVIQLGKTADWVAITPDAVWVGSTGPDAVHRIDPATNKLVATVELAGQPCSGLAVGFGSVWIPLCGKPAALAKVDAARLGRQRRRRVGTGSLAGIHRHRHARRVDSGHGCLPES